MAANSKASVIRSSLGERERELLQVQTSVEGDVVTAKGSFVQDTSASYFSVTLPPSIASHQIWQLDCGLSPLDKMASVHLGVFSFREVHVIKEISQQPALSPYPIVFRRSSHFAKLRYAQILSVYTRTCAARRQLAQS